MSHQPPALDPPAASGDHEWLTLSQAAKVLGVSQTTLRKWTDREALKAFYTPGGHRRYRRADLDAFVSDSGPGASRAKADGDGTGPVVLVVNPDERARRFVRQVLETEGYRVREAESDVQALERIHEQVPDLVMLDVAKLSEANGWRLLQELLEHRKSIPVVAFSGRIGPSPRGMSDKRLDPYDLLARAKQIVPI